MPKVKIYSTATCPYCHMEKNYLKSKGIEFEDVPVDRTPGAVEELRDKCGSMGVPCTHITKEDGSEEIILGFNKSKLDELLNIK